MQGSCLLPKALEELKLRALAFTSCGVSISDATRPEMPLIYVNEAFVKMTGYPSEEILGHNCRFLQGEDRSQPGLREVRAALKEGRHGRAVLRNYRRDGRAFWNELTLSPVLDVRRLTHFVGIQTDVTAREEAERERARLFGELEQANRRLDDFAHIVSHDLRAPLRNLYRLCDMLTEEHAAALGEQGKRLLGLLSARSRRLGTMIEGVLVYSRASRRQVAIEQVDLGRLVSEVIDLLEMPAGVRIEVPLIWPTIESDRVRLSQMLQNLLSNAIEHRDQFTRRIAVGVEDAGEVWRLWVEDDGPGIPPEHHERVFRIFETLDAQQQQAGIGLSIVQGAAEALGGAVRLEPGSGGRGARFTIELPKPVM
jgi:PAS domain S-box-containing protein